MSTFESLLILDETSWPRLLWNGLQGRTALLLGTAPFLPGTSFLLNFLRRLALKKGWVRDVFEQFPELTHFREMPWFLIRTDAYTRVSPAADKHFGIQVALSNYADYALPWAHVCNNRASTLLHLVLLISALLERQELKGIPLQGIDSDLAALVKAYSGAEVKPRNVPNKCINFFLAAIFLLYGAGWCILRTRLGRMPKEHVFLGADFVADNRLIVMLRDILGGIDNVLFLMRNQSQIAEAKHFDVDLKPLRRIYLSDCRFTPKELVSVIGMLARDGWFLLRAAFRCEPALFRPLGVLAVRRAMARALANRYRFDFFFGRDDYNVEHILRAQELRRFGTVNLGISHGLPAPALVDPVWRHIDFDKYFVFGDFQSSPDCYGITWPEHMKIEAVGSFGLSRAELAEMTPASKRPRSIVCYINHDLFENQILDIIRDVALAFPERQILVRPKPGLPGTPRAQLAIKVRDYFEAGPDNVTIYDKVDDTYRLLGLASYALCVASTVVVEAMQFDLKTFVFDLHKDQPFYFRGFPGLCFESASEIIRRIHEIEAGRLAYWHESFNQLTYTGSKTIYDIIRGALALPQMKSACP